jgi:hypothetical protein
MQAAAMLLSLPSLVNGQPPPSFQCPAHVETEVPTERDPPASDVTPVVETTATDGIAGYTTYRLSLALAGSAHNLYTIAGSSFNPMYIPGAHQVAPPFGADTGGTNPAYWAYNAECQYDSWLTAAMDNGASGLGNIGISFEDWTENDGITITDGAVFWMNPNDSPGRSPNVAGQPPTTYNALVAQLTVPTADTAWTFVVGEAQGRSTGYEHVPRVVDWRVNCISFSLGGPPPRPAVCPLTAANMQEMFDSINQQCCNGGHRRSLQSNCRPISCSSTSGDSCPPAQFQFGAQGCSCCDSAPTPANGACTLSSCSSGCAAVFDPVYQGCTSDSTYGPILSDVPNLQNFVTLCHLGR